MIVGASKCLWDSWRIWRGNAVRGKHRVSMWRMLLDRGRVVLSITLLFLWRRRRRWRSIHSRRSRRWGNSKNRLNLCAAGFAVNSLFPSRTFLCKVSLLFAYVAKQIWTVLNLKTNKI